MKNHYFKKLSGYSLISASFLAIGNKSEAQILYTDVDPDVTGGAITDIYVDLDNNGTDDFEFTGANWLWYNSVNVYALGAGDEILGAYPYESAVAALNIGDPITPDGPFGDISFMGTVGESYYYGGGYPFGDWVNVENKYVGVKIEVDGNSLYGWIRLDVSIGLEDPHLILITLKDYAVQLTPGTPIHAGDMDGCYTPIPTGTAAVTATTAKAKWGIVGGAEHFELRYKMTTALDWIIVTTPTAKTFKKLSDLNCSSEYEWQVRAICDDGSATDYSSSQLFNTAACRLDGSDPIETADAEIYTYADQIYIDIFNEMNAPAKFELFDLQGKCIISESINEDAVVINANVPDGIYIGTLHMNGTAISKKVIISR